MMIKMINLVYQDQFYLLIIRQMLNIRFYDRHMVVSQLTTQYVNICIIYLCSLYQVLLRAFTQVPH